MPTRRAVLRRASAVGLLAAAGCVTTPGSGAEAPSQTTVPTNATVTTRTTDKTTDGATNGGTGGGGTTTGGAMGGSTVEVAVGPEGRLRFVPEQVELAVGDRIVWTFESPGHNVTSLPGASEKCRNPPGAEPFASYEGQRHFSINEVGTTFEHTFAVPGEYVYVCEPHADQGMVGYVTVSEQ